MSDEPEPTPPEPTPPEPTPPDASTPTPASAEASGEGAPTEASAADGDAPKKRRRRRRRKKKKPTDGEPTQSEDAVAAVHASQPQAASEDGGAAGESLAALAGGLLSHIDDREVPCSAEGCDNTWSWTSAEQIKAFGKPPPRRMCDECRGIEDQALACSIGGCKRTWTWSRDAQLKHRSWQKRHGTGTDQRGKPNRGSASGSGKQRRRRGRADAPPRRKCDLCQAKLGRLVERETVCKVHGCTRTVAVDRDSQLRAWAALHTEDLDADATLPRKMCEVCRDFCRMHPDREVACGRPGCDRTWTYKTGAQLQAFLAGRLEDPIRLCDACAKGGFANAPNGAAGRAGLDGAMRAPDGSEVMPCAVMGCEGTWIFRPGMTVAPASESGDLPIDRMCEQHRVEHGGASVESATVPEAPEAPAQSVSDTAVESSSAASHPPGDDTEGTTVTVTVEAEGHAEASEPGERPVTESAVAPPSGAPTS